jgi:hypothetical protein
MIDEYELMEDDVNPIDGSMDLGAKSPMEIGERRRVKRLSGGQFRKMVYEMTLKMLDEQLNEDDPAAAGAAPPMDPAAAGGAPMGVAGPGGPMPGAAPEDADKNPYRDMADKKKAEIAKKVGDNSGGAPGFNPKETDDDKKDKKDKKNMAERVAESVIKQITEHFKKNI